MKPQEIEKLKQLDKEGCNGTIASVLLDPNINQAHYADVLYYLLVKHIEGKSYFERTTNNMMRVLKSAGMHSELNKCLELEEKL
ncbi:hypothetical protein D3C85_1198450 [compost metagenome]